MGIIAITFHPFDSGAGAPVYEAQWRKMAEHWLSTGVLRGELNQLAVSATGAGMTVNVATGRAWVKGHFFESDAVEARSIDSADPTNPRIDRVVVRATYSQPGVPGAVALAVLKGTPAASPSAPALTQNTTTMWEISLAQVLIDAGAVVVAANKVTDERTLTDTTGETVQVLGRKVTTTTVTNNNTEKTVYTKTVSGGLLGTDGMLRLRAFGRYNNSYGTNSTFTVRVTLGTTTVCTLTETIARNTSHPWSVDVLLANMASAAIQLGIGHIIAEYNEFAVAQAAATEDTAANKNLVITMQHELANASITAYCDGALLELIKPTI